MEVRKSPAAQPVRAARRAWTQSEIIEFPETKNGDAVRVTGADDRGPGEYHAERNKIHA